MIELKDIKSAGDWVAIEDSMIMGDEIIAIHPYYTPNPYEYRVGKYYIDIILKCGNTIQYEVSISSGCMEDYVSRVLHCRREAIDNKKISL
jgi:hypothetical protein